VRCCELAIYLMIIVMPDASQQNLEKSLASLRNQKAPKNVFVRRVKKNTQQQ